VNALHPLGKNNVELVGFYGGDETHALSAWTSTGRDLTEERRKRIPALLKMLAQQGHHTPFEKSALHFLVTCETASHIHLIKHRIGVSVNGESARYKELKEDKFYLPVDWPKVKSQELESHSLASFVAYHQAIEDLVSLGFDRKRAKESARFFLPYANQLTLDVQFNFRSFMHFQSLRNKPDAQLEIQAIAGKMLTLVQQTGAFKYSLIGFGYAST
jgi:flavin-dependent thymidylate synthase